MKGLQRNLECGKYNARVLGSGTSLEHTQASPNQTAQKCQNVQVRFEE